MKFPIAHVHRFAGGLDHSEGVAVASDGTVFAGGEAGQVYRISADGRNVTELARTGGFSLGITLDRRENVFVCDMKLRSVLIVDLDGKVSLFADSAGSRKFQTPNFAVFDSEGNLYLSDSGEWKQNNGLIYKIDLHGRAWVFHPGPFAFANGLALNAAEDTLFVVESNANRISRIEIRKDGTAGDVDVFCEGLEHVPDGIALDARGHLYVGCFGMNRLYVANGQGQVELLCEDLENATLSVPTNCAFGGNNYDQLYVACMGGSHIAVLDLKTPGQPLYAHEIPK
jgi:gluconolactonase